MTLSLDAATTFGAGSGNRNISHAAGASPKGLLVVIPSISQTDDISGITWDGDPLEQVIFAAVTTGLENGSCQAWFIGAGLSGGTKTLAITGTLASYCGHIWTVNAADDTSIDTFGAIASDTGSDFAIEFSGSGGNPAAPSTDVFVGGGIWSSTNATTGLTGFAGQSDRFAIDFGSSCGGTGSLSSLQPAGTFTWDPWGGSNPGEHALVAVCIQEGGVVQEPEGWPDSYLGTISV